MYVAGCTRLIVIFVYLCGDMTKAAKDSETLRQRTARGLLWGGIGSGGMQLLNLLFGVVLSRLLSPGDYGLVGALTIFSATAGVLAESGFTYAIANRRAVADRDYNSVFWFNIGLGALLYAVLWLAAPAIAAFYHKPGLDGEIVPLARFLFLGFLIGSTAVAPTAYFFRNLNVKTRSKIQLTAILVSGTAGVVCAVNGMGYWGIAVQTVSYSATNAVLMWVAVPWRPTLSFEWEPIREMLPFSLRQLLTSLFTHINNNFFAMLLGRFYTMQQTGYYTQAAKWTNMGSSTITGMLNSVAQPVLREAADSGDDRLRARRVFLKMLRFTCLVSFPAMLGLAITAPELIVLSVTDKWADCVPAMRILCLGGAFAPVSVLYASLFNSLNRPGIYMWNTIALGLAQLCCVLFTYRLGLETMLWCYTAINIGWLLVWQWFAWRHIGLALWDVAKAITVYLVPAAIAVAGGQYAGGLVGSLWGALAVKIAVAAAIYCVIMWVSGSVVFRDAIKYFAKKK